MDPSRKLASSQRLPPPVLFQGPPSHNASNISLSVPPAPSGSQPPPLQRRQTSRSNVGEADIRTSLPPFITHRASKSNDVDGSDAIWQEMQSALSEVELSAVTGGNVFGEKHAEALEDLRLKQLKLAQAWARSEADDEVVDSAHSGKDRELGSAVRSSPSAPAPASAPSAEGVAPESRAAVEGVSYHTLDEETEKDILLARRRREANDRYFDRVNQGVLDVVAKLEEVAQAMRAVERESKDIWSDSDSGISAAPTSNTG